MDTSDTSLVVTGLGLTTCLGQGLEENWRKLAAGDTGITRLTRLDVTDTPVTDGGEAPLFDGMELATGLASGRVRAMAYLEHTGREAFRVAGIDEENAPDPERRALVLGSSLAGSAASPSFWEEYIEKGPVAANYALLESYAYCETDTYTD